MTNCKLIKLQEQDHKIVFTNLWEFTSFANKYNTRLKIVWKTVVIYFYFKIVLQKLRYVLY